MGYDSAITGVDVNVNSTSTPRQNPLVLALHSTSHATGSVSGAATLKDAPSNAGIFVYLLGTSSICVTDTDGKFSLAGLAPGSYTIMASKEGYSAQSASVIIPSGPASPISFILTILGPYFVTYDSNGGTGNVPIDPTNYMEGFRVTVLGNSGNLMNPGFSFDGWNTQADGKGISYTQGQTFVMGSSHVVLYATWALAATEYFISFKYDGTQVRFTHGVLEWGDVPLAGVEVGWQHDGHVYDRTHILAIPVGLPMTNFPGDTSIEIVLAGEPGTQPPPAGTYTFSDGVHMIHDITYAAPGIRSNLYYPSGSTGSATVVLTAVGTVGGFIEGSFSATVLDENTRAPHYITEGMFHVRLLSLGTSTLTGTFASPDAVTVPNGAHGFLKLVSSGGLPTDTSPSGPGRRDSTAAVPAIPSPVCPTGRTLPTHSST